MVIPLSVPIPERMRHLKVDPRGYAIPYGVVIDRDGAAHFSINDEVTRRRSVMRDRCSICGTPLLRGRWFVGGPLSAFHPMGAFIDPPMHYECSHYALQVCPYLAAPHYVREIGLHKAESKREALADNMVLLDPTMIPGRPRDETFVAICATGQDIFNNGNTKPKHPYLTIEFWKHGRLIERLTGAALKLRCIAEADRALAERPLEGIRTMTDNRQRSETEQRYHIRTGGLMRCCLATLDEWADRVAAGDAAPPQEGDTMQCKYHDGEGMRFRDGAWEWAAPPLEP